MQKTIVKNGLIAVLFALMMIVLCMPAKADAMSRETGKMEGMYFVPNATYEDKSIDVSKDITATYDNQKVISVSAANGRIDLTELYNDFYAAEANKDVALTITIKVYYEDRSYPVYSWPTLIPVNAVATTDVAVTSDTEFEYGIDSIFEEYYYEESEGVYIGDTYAFEAEEINKMSNVANKLVIKKGEKSSNNKLIVSYVGGGGYTSSYVDTIRTFNVKELSNNANLAVNPTIYGVRYSTMSGTFSEVSYANFDNDPSKYYEAAKAIAEMSKTSSAEYEAAATATTALDSKLVAVDTMTFEHKGVQTDDANDIALWIALFAIAAVAAGAVTLKKN